MLTQKQLERYADVLWWGLTTARSRAFKKNDLVIIRYDLPALRLAEVLYARLLERGLHPEGAIVSDRVRKGGPGN